MAGLTSAGPVQVIVAGVMSGVVVGLLTYALIVRPIQRLEGLSEADEHVFMLVGTLLWTIILQEILANVFGDVPVSVPQIVSGVVNILGVRTPISSLTSSKPSVLLLAFWPAAPLWEASMPAWERRRRPSSNTRQRST